MAPRCRDGGPQATPQNSVALGDAVTSVFEGLGYERLFVVDPIGNAVLGYDPDFERVGLLNDLERLLRLSSIG